MESVRQDRICVTKLFEILQKPQVNRLLSLVRKVAEAGLSIVVTIFPEAEWMFVVAGILKDDCDFEEVMKNFQKINGILKKIEHRLETNACKERWNHVKTRFISSVETLEECFKFYCHASESTNDSNVLNWIDQLLSRKDFLCSSFDKLLKGMSRGQDEFHEDVLEAYYDLVKGDKHKMERFCSYVLQMMLNGFAVSCLALTLSKDYEWCEEFVDKFKWQTRLLEAVESMTRCVKKCEDEYKTNIEKDVDVILNGAEDQVEDNLDWLFSKKYGWLETFWLLYRCSSNEQNNLKSEKHIIVSKNKYDTVDGGEETSDNTEGITKDISVDLNLIYLKENSETLTDQPDCFLMPRAPNIMALYAFIRNKSPETISDSSFASAQSIVSNSIKQFKNSRWVLEKIKSDLASANIPYWGLVVLNQSNPFKNQFSQLIHSPSLSHHNLVKFTKHQYSVFLLIENLGDQR